MGIPFITKRPTTRHSGHPKEVRKSKKQKSKETSLLKFNGHKLDYLSKKTYYKTTTLRDIFKT